MVLHFSFPRGPLQGLPIGVPYSGLPIGIPCRASPTSLSLGVPYRASLQGGPQAEVGGDLGACGWLCLPSMSPNMDSLEFLACIIGIPRDS